MENKLIKWAKDGYPPIDLNEQSKSVIDLIKEINSLKLEKEAILKNKISSMALSMEFGYKQCERGNNLEMAFINFNKTINQQ